MIEEVGMRGGREGMVMVVVRREVMVVVVRRGMRGMVRREVIGVVVRRGMTNLTTIKETIYLTTIKETIYLTTIKETIYLTTINPPMIASPMTTTTAGKASPEPRASRGGTIACAASSSTLR